MTLQRAILGIVAFAVAAPFCEPAFSETTTIIMKGKVAMIDGSVPTKPVAIQRECSDQGSAPGPLADKQGNWVWSQALDPMTQRACYLQAELEGFTSSRFEMGSIPLSAYQGSGILNIPTLVLAPKDSGDLEVIILPTENSIPGKAAKEWKEVVKSLKMNDEKAAIGHLEAAVQAANKFPEGWNLLGAMYERDHQPEKAREALQHAIEQNPKLVGPEVRMARVCDELGQWDAASKAAATVIKAEPRFYPEIYLHQAIARLGVNDLDGARTSVETAMKLDPAHKYPRSEYVLGRVLQAKGDMDGARQHIAKYLEMDPGSADARQIKVLLDYLGKPDAPKMETGLERPY